MAPHTWVPWPVHRPDVFRGHGLLTRRGTHKSNFPEQRSMQGDFSRANYTGLDAGGGLVVAVFQVHHSAAAQGGHHHFSKLCFYFIRSVSSTAVAALAWQKIKVIIK